MALASSGPAPAPAVLIIPAIFGVTRGIEELVEELAEETGALAVAVDPFWRTDSGALGYEGADRERALARMRSYDRRQGAQDFACAVDALRVDSRCDGTVGVLGICFGGAFACRLALDGAVDFALSWHGAGLGALFGEGAAPPCPLTLHFGAEDHVVSMDEVDAIRAALVGQAEVRLHVHPGCGHGFTHRGSRDFNPRAATLAFESLKQAVGAARRETRDVRPRSVNPQ